MFCSVQSTEVAFMEGRLLSSQSEQIQKAFKNHGLAGKKDATLFLDM